MTIMISIAKKGVCNNILLLVVFRTNTAIILPLVLISEESLEIAINAWDALFFGVAEMKRCNG